MFDICFICGIPFKGLQERKMENELYIGYKHEGCGKTYIGWLHKCPGHWQDGTCTCEPPMWDPKTARAWWDMQLGWAWI